MTLPNAQLEMLDPLAGRTFDAKDTWKGICGNCGRSYGGHDGQKCYPAESRIADANDEQWRRKYGAA